ncbi:MAG: sel1 repeat family protein [Sterolibacterium sp.]|jgi:hypothetical protein|nr:sel1 repeat family protein [Sterolibacterium sp.]
MAALSRATQPAGAFPLKPSLPLEFIHFDTAMALTGMSKRTLWRRISAGELRKVGLDAGKSRLSLMDVLTLTGMTRDEELATLLRQADQGEAEAQADVAQLLFARGRHAAAARWFQRAANQGYPDAMLCLGRSYATGDGVIHDENLAVMWIAKAAAAGHPLALAQMKKLKEIL